MRESFSNTISQTDLIVGVKGGTIQLLLYSVFGMGSPTSNLSWDAYREWAEHPAVEWTIPYALGDSHRGYRVIGTNEDFYRHYRYRGGQAIALAEGRAGSEVFDVTLGADVASRAGLRAGRRGRGDPRDRRGGVPESRPPALRGGRASSTRTFTPVDRAVYVTLEGIEAIHFGWEDGAPPMDEHEHTHEEVLAMEEIEITQVTSFFVGTTSRRDVLRLQREINDFEGEPMMAVIPGLALNEMWQGIGYAETGLRLVTIFVVLVGLLGMLVSLYTSLNERRREMAILRAVGVGARRASSRCWCWSRCAWPRPGLSAGSRWCTRCCRPGQPIVEAQVGLFIPIRPPGSVEWLFLGAVVGGRVPDGIRARAQGIPDGASRRAGGAGVGGPPPITARPSAGAKVGR